MNQLINTPATMSSREIAELTGSTHDNVLKTIRKLRDEGVVRGNDTPYVHQQNGQTYTEIRLDFRNSMVVVSGYSAELRARIIDRWQELEVAATAPTPAVVHAPLPMTPIEFEQQALAVLRVVMNEDMKRSMPLLWQELADEAQNAMRAAMGTLKALPAPSSTPKPLDIMEIAKQSALHVPQKLRSAVGKYVKARSTVEPVEVERLIHGSIRSANAYVNHAEVAGLVQAYLATQASD